MSTSNRRSFLTHAAGGAGVLLAAGGPLVLTARKASAQSGLPGFNPAGISSATLSNFQSIFLNMANIVTRNGSGAVTQSDLAYSQSAYVALAAEFQSSGFNAASTQYLNGGPATPNGASFYSAMEAAGLAMPAATFESIYGPLMGVCTNQTVPTVAYYAASGLHEGAANALGVAAGSGSAANAAVTALLRQPSGISPLNRPAPSPSKPAPPKPDEGSGACWYANAALAYFGVMMVPLGIGGAIDGPILIGLGAFLAFAGVFAWAFC